MGAAIRAALMTKGGRIFIYVIVAAIFLLLLRNKITTWLNSLKQTGKDEYRVGWGNVTEQWRKETLSGLVIRSEKALKFDWTLFFDGNERCVVLKQIYTLNNNQLVALSNSYRKYHKKSFPDDVKSAVDDGCSDFFTKDTQTSLIARLNSIGVR